MATGSNDASGTTQANDDIAPRTESKHVETATRAGKNATRADVKAARTRRGKVDKNDGDIINAKAREADKVS